MTAQIYEIHQVATRNRGVWPLGATEVAIPDDWRALLDQLHGHPEAEPPYARCSADAERIA